VKGDKGDIIIFDIMDGLTDRRTDWHIDGYYSSLQS